MKIIQNNPIHCIVQDFKDVEKIKKLFEYKSEFWIQGPYHKIKKSNNAYLINRPHKGWFLAGMLPTVKKYCELNNIPFEYENNALEKIKKVAPTLPGITFRPDQICAINAAVKNQRGIIKAPTGSGKTVIAGGVISQYKKSKAVMVVHTKSLFTQTIDELRGWFGNDDVGFIGGGKYNPKRITVCIIQTCNKLLGKKNAPHNDDFYDLLADVDIVVIDEAHHLAKENGHYVELMEACLAPIRIGFTATPNPKNKVKARLVGEGYLGPIIYDLKVDDGIKSGILATPRLKLIPVPKIKFEAKTYKETYKKGIILNKVRNRLIAKEASEHIRQGKSVLIMITDVVNGHADIIQTLMKDLYDTDADIINGKTDVFIQQSIKQALKEKQTCCVIVTSMWREGINIPTLDCVINAAGSKSDIAILQTIGRGLRTTKGKSEIVIVDFLDPHKYLAQHSIERLRIYNEIGILNQK